MSLCSLGVCETAALLRSGEQTAETLASDCLERIDEFEPVVQAWAYLDRESVTQQAKACDLSLQQEKPTGPLHGVTIGIKDIIDTRSVPTEYGCSVFSGRVPTADAWLVERLRQAGAIIVGKTVTAEMATFAPGKTTNPHNPEHTPGGSSSGSAAAVASFMVSGAIGTQTNGSVIRPASFCGVYGFKPSHGLIPRHGVLKQSPFLDQVGVFARSVKDVALLAESIIGQHYEDGDTHPNQAMIPLLKICEQPIPKPPKIGFVRTTKWSHANANTQQSIEQLREKLGSYCEEISLPKIFGSVWDWLKLVNEADIATHYGPLFENQLEKISDLLAGQIERGAEVKVVDYHRAVSKRAILNRSLDEIFEEYDVLLAPAATGEAPQGLSSTGDPVFCTPWTFAGMPSLNIPLLQGETGLPIGIQLVGKNGDDARLLRAANWLVENLVSTSN